MKKLVMLIMCSIGLVSLGYAAAELSIDQLKEVPQIADRISANYEKLNNLASNLAFEQGKTTAVLQDTQKSYGDQFVQMALFLNQLSPVLEIIIGSGKADELGHKQEGILVELNTLLTTLGKKPLSKEALLQIQNAIATQEVWSSFLTNNASALKGIKR